MSTRTFCDKCGQPALKRLPKVKLNINDDDFMCVLVAQLTIYRLVGLDGGGPPMDLCHGCVNEILEQLKISASESV